MFAARRPSKKTARRASPGTATAVAEQDYTYMGMSMVTSIQSVVIQRHTDSIQWGMRLRACDRGLFIDALTPGSAAASAEYAGALKAGDVITHINEEAVTTDLCCPHNMAPEGVLQLQKSTDLAVRVIVLRTSCSTPAPRSTPARTNAAARSHGAGAAGANAQPRRGHGPAPPSGSGGQRSVYARLPEDRPFKRRNSNSGTALPVAVTVNPMFA